MVEGDLTLPEDDSEKDSRSIFEEERPKSKAEERALKRQKEFEYKEVEGREIRKKENKKKELKDKIFRIIIAVLALALLVALYFWLLR